MKLTLRRISEALVACSLAVITSTVKVSASPSVTIPADQRVLKEIKLDKQLTVLKTIVLGRYAYILATSQDRMIWVFISFLTSDGNWRAIRGHGEQIVDKPQKLFRHHRANLKYVLGRSSGTGGDMNYQTDWYLSGYTTDPRVTSFRIKTKTGYIPLETIHGRYFLRILSQTEHDNFVEVQGLNTHGEVIQRDNGEDDDKPRQWSPQHSELY